MAVKNKENKSKYNFSAKLNLKISAIYISIYHCVPNILHIYSIIICKLITTISVFVVEILQAQSHDDRAKMKITANNEKNTKKSHGQVVQAHNNVLIF